MMIDEIFLTVLWGAWVAFIAYWFCRFDGEFKRSKDALAKE